MSSVLILLVSSIVLVVAFGALGIGAVWWALFGDKARARRCPRCWHDLSGTPGMTCGECGHVARNESELWRTRRRWGVAATALMSILAITAWARLEVINASWVGFVPNAVLVHLPRLLPNGELPNWAQNELNNRIVNGELDGSQMLALIDVLDPHGPALGSPDDPRVLTLARATFSLPGEFVVIPNEPVAMSDARRTARTAFESERARRLSLFAPWIEVIVPQDWPADTSPVASVRGTVWGSDTEWRVRVNDEYSNWLVGDGMSALRRQPAFGALQLPAPDADGNMQATLEYEIRRRNDDAAEWSPWIAQPPITINAIVRPLDVALVQPADDLDLTQAARGAFDFSVSIWTDDDRPAGIRFNTRSFAGGDYADMLIGVVLELREDGVVRRRSHLWWPGSSIARTGWEIDFEDLEALRRLRAKAAHLDTMPPHPDGGHTVAGWTIAVRGDPLIALRAAQPGALSAGAMDMSAPATEQFRAGFRAWSGQFDMPLRVSERPESAPKRVFRSEPRASRPVSPNNP